MQIYTHAVGAAVAVTITEHPENVTALIGDSVIMRCEYEGTSTYPKWIINDTEYSPFNLPPQYMSGIKGLTIPYVQESMNNTKFTCAFSPKPKSHAGYLTVIKQGDVPFLIFDVSSRCIYSIALYYN